MSVDVRALITKKRADKSAGTDLVIKDINHDLIVTLLALPVYGKEVRDEEILSIIINAGVTDMTDVMTRIRNNYAERVKAKQVKKTKSGVRDTEGFLVLVPRG